MACILQQILHVLIFTEITQANIRSERDGQQDNSDHNWKHITREITRSHKYYDLLECVQDGLHDLLQGHPQLGPKEKLEDTDYDHVLQTNLTLEDEQSCIFTSYASAVFSTIRDALAMDEENYMTSICNDDQSYLEFISNSKGGQSFYLSHDKAYFIKTETPKAMTFLRHSLRRYVEHFYQYPHSLLVKYLAIISVQLDHGETIHLYVMQSIFHPEESIEKRYDVKGSLNNRYQQPVDSSEGAVIQIFKDENFLSEMIDVGDQRDWLMRQIEYDVTLLRSYHVTDYSMLIGYRPLEPALIVYQESSKDISIHRSCEEPCCDKSTNISSRLHHQPFRINNNLLFLTNHDPTLSLSQNRRTLSHHWQPLHVIDGPRYRYYVGIIDFCGNGSSGMSPDHYAQRFIQFMENHIR